MRRPALLPSLAAPAAPVQDLLEPFHADAVALAAAASELCTAAVRTVRPANDNRQRILTELRDFCDRANLLALETQSDSRRTEAFRALARANDLCGFLAADLPRSRPFASVLPLAERVREALAAANESGAAYFGTSRPGPDTAGLAAEVARRAAEMPDLVRRKMGRSERRSRLVARLEEFEGHCRAFATTLTDPLLTEDARRARLHRLLSHADDMDLAFTDAQAREPLRATWAGLRDTLAFLRSRFERPVVGR